MANLNPNSIVTRSFSNSTKGALQMQDPTPGNRFLFHGHAIAAAGKITSPFQDIIPAQAASALPIDGGYGSARVENFRYKEIFSFASAYSEVAGTFVEREGGAYETLSLTA